MGVRPQSLRCNALSDSNSTAFLKYSRASVPLRETLSSTSLPIKIYNHQSTAERSVAYLNPHARAAARVPFPKLSHFRKNFWHSV